MALCRLCGEIINDLDFEKHLWVYHCISYRDYYEVIMHMSEPEECWKCGTIKYPISYIHSDFPGIPCWGCIKKKSHLDSTRKQVLDTLKEMLDEILRNKYYRHLVCFPKDLSSSITHNLPETAGILDTISKKGITRPGKKGEEVFRLIQENLGCPYEISSENLDSMVMELLPVSCDLSEEGIYEVILGDHVYHVELPEILSYEGRHYPRFDIFSYPRKIINKQLRIGRTDKVYKLFDPLDNPDIRSIFRVRERVREEDKCLLCDVLLSNKVFSSIIREIYEELLNHLVGIFDRAFFKNYIRLNQPGLSGTELEFAWSEKETDKELLTILIWS